MHVVKLLDACFVGGPLFVTEYMPGENLVRYYVHRARLNSACSHNPSWTRSCGMLFRWDKTCIGPPCTYRTQVRPSFRSAATRASIATLFARGGEHMNLVVTKHDQVTWLHTPPPPRAGPIGRLLVAAPMQTAQSHQDKDPLTQVAPMVLLASCIPLTLTVLFTSDLT